MGYYLYKGLQKPLVLFGLKDKYIYYGLGSALGGMVLAVILSNIIGLIGLAVGLAGGGLGFWYTIHTQDKKGLYNRQNDKDILYVVKPRIRTSKKIPGNENKTKNT